MGKSLKIDISKYIQVSQKVFTKDGVEPILIFVFKKHLAGNMPVWNWSLTISQLAIFFKGRLEGELKI